MRPHRYSSEGIVLGRRNYGEADRILSLLSREQGRIALLAKGIRRPKSRKRGHLEIFSYIKFEGTRGMGLDLITEAEVIDDFNDLRKNLSKVAIAYYFMEVVGKITHDQEKNPELFELLLHFLGKLRQKHNLKKLRYEFIGDILVLMGFWPEGKVLNDPDKILEEVTERQIASARVGKRMLE